MYNKDELNLTTVCIFQYCRIENNSESLFPMYRKYDLSVLTIQLVLFSKTTLHYDLVQASISI